MPYSISIGLIIKKYSSQLAGVGRCGSIIDE
jgi:hypothetical protein